LLCACDSIDRMSKRRTRAHKQAVLQKKQEVSTNTIVDTDRNLESKTRRDLTRSLLLTILALILQISLKIIIERR
jgi:hypothetical protein